MGYNDRNGCDGCMCKFCKNNKNCNAIDQRCDKCRTRKFKQILYDHLLCEEFNKSIPTVEKPKEKPKEIAKVIEDKEVLRRRERLKKEAEQREIEKNKGKRRKDGGK